MRHNSVSECRCSPSVDDINIGSETDEGGTTRACEKYDRPRHVDRKREDTRRTGEQTNGQSGTAGAGQPSRG